MSPENFKLIAIQEQNSCHFKYWDFVILTPFLTVWKRWHLVIWPVLSYTITRLLYNNSGRSPVAAVLNYFLRCFFHFFPLNSQICNYDHQIVRTSRNLSDMQHMGKWKPWLHIWYLGEFQNDLKSQFAMKMKNEIWWPFPNAVNSKLGIFNWFLVKLYLETSKPILWTSLPKIILNIFHPSPNIPKFLAQNQSM